MFKALLIITIIAVNYTIINATINDIIRKNLSKEQVEQLTVKLKALESRVNIITTEALKKGINNESGICAFNELRLEHAGRKAIERAQLCIEERTDSFKNISSLNNVDLLHNVIDECMAMSENIEKKIIRMFLNCEESHNIYNK